jgi:hypothetical protein
MTERKDGPVLIEDDTQSEVTPATAPPVPEVGPGAAPARRDADRGDARRAQTLAARALVLGPRGLRS